MHRLLHNQRAFLKAYPTLFDRIYRYTCARCSNQDDGKDIVSEVFIRAFERLDSFDEAKGSLEQWVMGITKFALIDYWRSRTTDINLDQVDPIDSHSTVTTLDDALSFEHRIRTLPDPAKALLRLKYIDGMTFDEISDVLGKNPSTVRSYFSRLHQKLRLDHTYEKS